MTNMSLIFSSVLILFAWMAQKQIVNKELLIKITYMLKQLRLEKELTQEDVYNDTGIHIARIESGKGNVSISTLSKLLEYYKISLSQFFIKISE
jgi:hypothetical protein